MEIFKCNKCGKGQPLNNFSIEWANNKKWRRPQCKNCRNTQQRAQYRRSETQRAKRKERARKIEIHHWNRRFTYLNGKQCIDCGNSNPLVLEFDHKDPKQKINNIGSMRNQSDETVKAEMDKCEIRCVNCHRKKTAAQRGYYRYKLQTTQ